MMITLLSAGFSFSQIVYNSTDFASIGDSTHVSKSSTGLGAFDFVQTGANHTWNYDNLPVSTQNDVKWIEPSNAGYKSTWCLSHFILVGCNTQFENFTNLAVASLDSLQFGSFEVSNVIEHYEKSSNILTYKMLGGTLNIGGLPIIKIAEISDADTVYNFPLEYNKFDSCSNNYTIKISGDSTKYVSYYRRFNHVEGWGSLTTPYKTFSNVLKVRTTLSKIDTFYLAGTPYQYIDTIIEFKWFDRDYKIPVLEVKANKIGQNILATGITYIDSLRCVDPQAYFFYSPLVPYIDSISGTADIAFSNLSSNADSVLWNFGDGGFSTEYNPNHTYSCPGVKIVSLIAVSKNCSPYRVDTVTIPIIVQDTSGTFSGIDQQTACDSFTWIDGVTYTTSNNTATFTLIGGAANGCDSIVTLDLTINSVTDITASVAGATITANNSNATYIWLDCDNHFTPVPGETDQSFTAETSGNFAVQLTENGCVDTSSCLLVAVVGVIDNSFHESFSVYPNPTYGEIWIEFESPQDILTLSLYSISGQLIKEEIDEKSSLIKFKIESTAGEYLLKISKPNGQEALIRIIKEN